MSAAYQLRFQLFPTGERRTDRDRIDSLIDYCQQHGIAEVAFMLGAEAAFDGRMSVAALEPWLAMLDAARGPFDAAGLALSVNPWVTLGHADRGRGDLAGITPMVGADGTAATAQASILCPVWRSWVREHYGAVAALAPRTLWIEDDFRYHNHAPLGWGGGFEPAVLQRVSHLVGEPVTRDALLETVDRPGPPHPWRIALATVWRDAQLEVARELAAVVADRSGGRTRLGLMSSGLSAASVEGRDWPQLFSALTAGTRRPVHRPHFAAYQETSPRSLVYSLWMLSWQNTLRPDRVESAPEIENAPHLNWSKSHRQCWQEMVAAAALGSSGLMLDLHPFTAGRPDRHPDIGELLDRTRPALDVFEPVGVADGLVTMWPPDAATRVPGRGATGTAALADLTVPAGDAAEYLLPLGVPVRMATQPVPGATHVLLGRLAEALTDDEIDVLLRGPVMLDGESAAVLVARGFGALLGVTAVRVVRRNEVTRPGPYAVEVPQPPSGLDPADQLAVNQSPAFTVLQNDPAAVAWTTVRSPSGGTVGPGLTVFDNAVGGRVAVRPTWSLPGEDRSDEHRVLLHRLIQHLDPAPPPLVTGLPHLVPVWTLGAGGSRRLTVFNASGDDGPAMVHGIAPGAEVRSRVLTPLAEPVDSAVSRAGSTVALSGELPDRGVWVLDLAGPDALGLRDTDPD